MLTRLQWRIAASYVALIATVHLALGVYLSAYLRGQQLAALEAQLDRQARLVADAAQPPLLAREAGSPGSAAGGPESLDGLAKRLGSEIGARITLIAADGTVLGDSDHDPATMDNHGTRPEVVQALRSGSGQSQRHSATLDRDLLYVAVPIQQEGITLSVARVALPVSQVQEALNRVAAAVATALVAAAVLAIGLAIVLARLTTRRIEALTRAARRFGHDGPREPLPAHVLAGRDEVGLLARTLDEMAARLRAHVRAVEGEREQLAAVLRHMADGVVIANERNIVELINPAAERLLGLPSERAEGRSVMAVLHDHELAAVVRQALAGDPAAERPRVVELDSWGGGSAEGRGAPSRPAGGEGRQRRAVQVLASPLPEHAGSGGAGGRRVLLMLQDVSELRRTEAVRRDLVTNVSHELRTPVAALKAVVEALEDGALEVPEVARDFVARMHVEVDGLARLVEELLELSRLESGQLRLQWQTIYLGSVVAAAAERLRPLAERHGLTLTVQVPADLPAVHADPDRMQQVVVNLVHNAAKFTPPGGHVLVAAERRGEAVAVTVSDTGIGIAPEALPRLFERFYKVDRARAGGGTGLGLAIAKHLVQAHGGRIWAESAGEGHGAAFTFTLPVAAATPSS